MIGKNGLLGECYCLIKMGVTFSFVQGYWDRKGENEIDIVAVNDFEKRMLIGEVKRNETRINLHILENKAVAIAQQYADYQIEYRGFSLKDM